MISFQWFHDDVTNGKIFRVTGPLCGEITDPAEFPTQRPVTRNFDVFFDLRLNTRWSKRPWGWWFKTPSWSSWRQYNVIVTTHVPIARGRHISLDILYQSKASINTIGKKSKHTVRSFVPNYDPTHSHKHPPTHLFRNSLYAVGKQCVSLPQLIVPLQTH